MHPLVSLNLVCFGEAIAGIEDLGTTLQHDVDFCVEAGFRRAGVTWSKVASEGVDRAAAIVRDSGLIVSTVLSPRMISVDEPSRWPAELAELRRRLEFAAEIGAETVYGPVGPAGPLDWEEAARRVTQAVREAVELSSRIGVPLIFEPTPFLYAELDFVHSFRDALHLAEMAGLGLCLDLFSVWQEQGLFETARAALPRLHLVQLGDFLPCRSLPNRVVPGDGMIPLQTMIGRIVELGYRKAFDLELIGPLIRAEGVERAAVRSGEYLSNLLEAVGLPPDG